MPLTRLPYLLGSLLLLQTFFNPLKAQDSTYSFAPADSQFTMQLARHKNEVIITLTFAGTPGFDYIAIERKADFSEEFSQCKYITSDEVKKAPRLVEKDTYPFPAASAVQYRVKMANKDGAMRTYPAITLPPLH